MSTQQKKTGSATGNDAGDVRRRARRRINPAAIPPGALLHHLKTDPETGLSPREAEKRLHPLSSARHRPLFLTGTLTPSGCIKRLCREPVLWLFLAVCLSALFFGRVAMGLACLGLTLAYGAVCTLCYIRSQRVDAAMRTMEAPLCRVLRNRRVRRLAADCVVRGDIILLYPGDVVPADARLLSADPDFCVVERELSGDPAERRSVRLTKDPETVVLSAGRDSHSPDNMVFAGGVVECGRARAVVVATGQQTHLGALTGGVKPVGRGELPASFRHAEKILNLCNLTLLALVIPLTIIGYLTLGSRYDLLDIVLTAMTLCVTSLTGHLLIRAACIGASLRSMAATDRDTACSADIRASETLDVLNRIDELVLVGTAGLHDGVAHPEFLTVGTARYDCTRPGADEAAERFAACAYLFRAVLQDAEGGELPVSAEGEVLLRERLSLLDALVEWAELSPEDVQLRVSAGFPCKAERAGGQPTVRIRWKDGDTTDLGLYSDFDETVCCTLVPDGKENRPMTEEERETLRRTFRQARLAGLRTCFLLSSGTEGVCLEGMLAYGPHTCRKTDGAIRALEADGIRVTAFLHDVTEENARVLSECGITSGAPSNRPQSGEPRTPAVILRRNGTAAFEGCSASYILEYIRARRGEGSRICVLAGERRDRMLLESADIACTVCPGLFRSAMNAQSGGTGVTGLEPGASCDADGNRDSACASDLCRRRSDVTVRRVSREGGGILGVRQAFLTAARYRDAMAGAVRFFAISQLLRVLMLAVPVCMGAALPGAPWLLLSGMVADTLALLSLSVNDTSPSLMRRRVFPADWRQLLHTLCPDLIGAGGAVACLWTTAGVGMLLAVSFGTAGLDGFAGLSLLTIQLALYVTDPMLARRTRSGFCFLLAFLLLWVGALAVTLGSGLRLYWSLVFPLCGGGLFLALRALARVSVCLFGSTRRRL